MNIPNRAMRKTTINFTIDLDSYNVPEKIEWNASDKPESVPTETKSISISLWDQSQKNTLRIDLWTKDMPIDEMKRFYIDCLGGLAQSILSSTNDEFMASETNALCDRLVKHLQQGNSQNS
ncbi:gliding motility protein GldC [Oscillatoria amoena NRMC-F 0135]|nr:gliding motility protein GldC [Oscillatoria amoena NRMC-F 0135]